MHTRLFLAVMLLLACTSQAQWTYGRNGRIDPGRILWWQDTWTLSPIELSRTNAGETADFTFKFTPTTTVDNGCVEIYFPTDIIPPGASASNMVSNCDSNRSDDTLKNLKAMQDDYYKVSSVPLPITEGAYGPFHIITRNYYNGQIVDVSRNFASIYVGPAVVTEVASFNTENMIVSLVSGTDIAVKYGTALTFRFNVHVDLWEHDMFVIYTASNWSTPTAPACQSLDITNVTNHFTNADGTTKLDCVGDPANNRVIVYGLANDLDLSALEPTIGYFQVNLRINGYFAPAADFQSTSYIWTNEIQKWQTTNVLRRYTATGPETKPGDLSLTNWVPYDRSFSVNNINQGMTMYTDLTVTTLNRIPDAGRIELTFTNVVIHLTNWKLDADAAANGNTGYCFIQWFGWDYTCTTDTGKLTIEFVGDLPDNTTFQVTTLTNFSAAGPTVSGITYYDAASTIVDQTPAVTSISYNTASNVVSAFRALYRDDTESTNSNKTGVNAGIQYIYYDVQLQSTAFGSSSDAVFNFYFPFTTEGTSNHNIYVYGDSSNFQCLYDRFVTYTPPFATDLKDISPLPTIAYTLDTQDSSLTLTQFNLNTFTGARFGCANLSSGARQNINLPLVESNKATRYQTRVEVQVGTATYYGFQILTFVVNADGSATGNRVCGNAVVFTFQPPFNVNAVDDNRDYYLEFKFAGFASNQDLGSGLTLGQTYPFSRKANLGNTSILVLQDDSIVFEGMEGYLAANTYEFVTSISDYTNAHTFDMTFYFINKDEDPELRYELFKESTVSLAAITMAGSVAFAVDSQSYKVNAGINIDTSSSVTYASNNYYSVSLPQGFRIHQGSVRIDSIQAPDSNTYSVHSSDPDFKLPVLVGYIPSTHPDLDGTGVLQFRGVSASPYVQTALNIQAGDFANCYPNSGTFALTQGTITEVYLWPTTVEARSPKSFSTEFAIEFQIENMIPEGGQIRVQMDNEWSIVSASCSADGLSTSSTTSPVQCSLQGAFWVVTGFKQVNAWSKIQLHWADAIPPASQYENEVGHIEFLETRYNGMTIDTYAAGQNNTCRVTVPSPVGKTVFLSNQTIPSNAGEEDVDLYLKFKVEHDLPAGSVLSFRSATGVWNNLGTSKNKVSFSKVYSDIQVTAAEIRLTLAESIKGAIDELELHAVQIMQNPDVGFNGYFKVTTSYRGIVFDQDATSEDNHNQIMVTSRVAGVIDSDDKTISLYVSNTGEFSSYSFIIDSDQDFQEGDEIWVKFPQEYDEFLGKAYIKYAWGAPSTYYLDCKSEQLGVEIECIVNNRTLFVINGQPVDKNQQITLLVYDIKNPATTGAGVTNFFELWHMNDSLSAKAKNRFLVGVTITAFPASMVFKQVTLNTHDIFTVGEYQFHFYLTQQMDNTDEILLFVPRQYTVDLTETTNDQSCAFSTVDYSNNANEFSENVIAVNGSCPSSRNQITLQFELTNEVLDFSNSLKGILKISDMTNPEWGVKRPFSTDYTWDFDANNAASFNIYQTWTNQFELAAYDTENKVYYARTYINYNSAYLGFDQRRRGFVVNEEERITLMPGVQTKDIEIKTQDGDEEPLIVRYATITPVQNPGTEVPDKIVFSSGSSYRMKHGQYETNFRVSAASNLQQGLYYINWNLDQDTEEFDNTVQYDPPRKALLEIYPKMQATFSIESLSQIKAGSESRPIAVTLEYAPFQDITLKIKVDHEDITNITIKPDELEFKRDVNVRYFVVQVPSDYDIEDRLDINLKFEVTGSNKDSYKTPDNITFRIGSAQISHEGLITQLTHTELTRTSVDIIGTADSNGIFYYYIGAEGTDSPTTEQIVDQVGDFFNLLNQELTEIEIPENDPYDEVDPSTDDKDDKRLYSWVAFQRRVYAHHLGLTFVGAAVSIQGQQTVIASLEQLYAQTRYYIWCVMGNLSNYYSEPVTHTFVTLDMPEAALITLSFSPAIAEDQQDLVRNRLALELGVISERLIKTVVKQGSTRRLQTSQFQWYLPADRSVNGPTPVEIANLSSEEISRFQEDLVAQGINVTVSYAFRAYLRTDQIVPSWINGQPPALQSAAFKSITATMHTDTPGECCCLAVQGRDNNVNDSQLLLGLDEDNKPGISSCVTFTDIEKPTEVNIPGLVESTTYEIACMCYNQYPVWPTSVAYGLENNFISTFTGRTSSPETKEEEATDDDSAKYLVVWLLVLIFS